MGIVYLFSPFVLGEMLQNLSTKKEKEKSTKKEKEKNYSFYI